MTRLNRACALACGALLLAVWSTWPLSRSAARALPLGSMNDATVPLFNVWTIWWNAHSALTGFRGYWQAPIFYPTADTFAFSEPQTTTLLVAPVLWLTGSRVFAYNAYLWLSLILNGLLTVRLLRLISIGRGTAYGAGAAMLLLPIVHWQREVIQLVPLWGILWVWIALWKIRRQPAWWRGVELGLACAVTFLTCVHHTLFFVVLLAVSVWVLLDRKCCRQTLSAWLTATAVALPLILPVAGRLAGVSALHDFERPTDIVAQLSARPGDYTAAHGLQWINPGQVAARGYWRLSPGWVKLLLAAVGLAYGLRRRRWRRWTLFLAITGGAAFLLSLGTNLKLGPWTPWETLVDTVPGFAQVRNAYRFAYFVQMVIVLLAATGMGALVVLRRGWGTSSIARRWSGTGLLLLGLAAIFEVRPYPVRLVDVPDAAAHAGWIEFVTQNIAPGRTLLCLPMSAGSKAADFEVTTQWMYLATYHGLPLVNGYSGFFPASYFELQDLVNDSFPDEASLRELLQRHVQFVVVRKSDVVWESDQRKFGGATIMPVYEDPSGITIFELSRPEGTAGE